LRLQEEQFAAHCNHTLFLDADNRRQIKQKV
jgi:hypothetical protein